MDIALVLKYLALGAFQLGREYMYLPPAGGFVNNNEAEFNAITWNDPLPKPFWYDITDNFVLAQQWAIEQDVWANFPGIKTKVATMETGAQKRKIAIAGQSTNSVKEGAFDVAFSGTVSGANLVVHLTDNGASNGNALFASEVYLESLVLRAVEGTTPHSFGAPALSNGTKTLTIPVSKLASVLGILSLNQSAAGSTVAGRISGK